MKYLLTIATILFCIHLNAQTTRFNKVLEDTLSNTCFSVVQLDTGYVVSGSTFINGYQSLIIKGVDLYGDVRWNKHIAFNGFKQDAGFNKLKKDINGGYFLTGTIINLANNDPSVFLYKFNEQLDTICARTFFKDTIFATSYEVIQDNEGSFFIIGQINIGTSNDENYQVLLLKTDNEGNYLWQKDYGGDGTEVGWDIIETFDKGFLITGHTMSYNLMPYPQDWYMLKTDSLGDMQWEKHFGNPNYNDGKVMDVIQTKDSCFILTGGYIVGQSTQYPEQDKFASWIMKIDTLGDIIWEKKYNETYYNASAAEHGDTLWSYFGEVIELDDGNLVAICQYKDDYTVPSGNSYDNKKSKMYKFNSEGDTLWTKEYFLDDEIYWYLDNYLTSIQQTPDKGFIMSGYFNSAFFSPSYQMWLVKTDSMGCVVEDCENVWVEGIEQIKEGFEIYPNPASTHVYISINYKDINYYNNLAIEIFDLYGRIIQEAIITSNRFEIDVKEFPKGLYFVRVAGKDFNQTKKLIIE